MDVRLEVFGGVRVVGPDGDLPLSPQVTRLLAVLLADAGRVVTTERIIERVWPSDPPATATKVVHVGIGKLRRAFGTKAETADVVPGVVLRTVADGYVLDARAADLDEWRDAVATAERLAPGDPVGALAATDRARARGGTTGRGEHWPTKRGSNRRSVPWSSNGWRSKRSAAI